MITLAPEVYSVRGGGGGPRGGVGRGGMRGGQRVTGPRGGPTRVAGRPMGPVRTGPRVAPGVSRPVGPRTGIRTTGPRGVSRVGRPGMGAAGRGVGPRGAVVRGDRVGRGMGRGSRIQQAGSRVRSNPRLAAAHRNAMHNKNVQRHLNRDWNRFRWNRWGAFNAGFFFDLALISPWLLFPYSYYNYYWRAYNPCISYWGNFGYPCYWDYGYAKEINLVQYVANNDWDTAITKINARLDELEEELQDIDDKDDIEDLKDEIEELKWYVADIKKLKQSPLTQPTSSIGQTDESEEQDFD